MVAYNFCDQVHIKSISFETENSFKEENLCLNSNNVYKLQVQEIIKIHDLISKKLGLPLNTIFPDKINITLRETIMGPFASYASRDHISIGVYPNQNFKFDRSIYIHELGHLIAKKENLKEVNLSILFTEMFADFFALVMSENIIEPSSEKSCFDRLRYITEGQSFNVFTGYFSQFFSMKRAQKCCESKFLNQENINEIKFCQEVMKVENVELDVTNRFSPQNVDFDDIDSHQVGVPLLSFFKKLSSQTNISMKEIFLRLFHFKFEKKFHYRCLLENKTYDYETVLLKSFFDELYKKLNSKEKAIFKRLLKEKSVEKAFILEREFFKNYFNEKIRKENFMADFETLSCDVL